MEVGYFHGYIDGVDFVFVDNPIFHSYEGNIYGGSREVWMLRILDSAGGLNCKHPLVYDESINQDYTFLKILGLYYKCRGHVKYF